MSPAVTHLVKRDGRTVPWDRERIIVAIYKAAASLGGHDRDLSERLAAEVEQVLFESFTGVRPPTVEDVQDVVERVLIRNGHAKTARAFIVYRHDRARMRDRRDRSRLEFIPYKTMWQRLNWALEHRCETVEKLNARIRAGELRDLVRESDALYESILDQAAAAVLERKGELRFLVVAGPSSSGKTTTTHKLAQRLEQAGLHVIPMSLDNYFFDLELHPKDEFGDFDFETPEAMDLPLVNAHLAALDAGRGIDMPRYDFKTGKRRADTTRFEPEPNSIILLDTLHGLYGPLTESVPEPRKFRLYIETIAQLRGDDGRWIRWTDVRLLRRMLRDSLHRGYRPEQTLLHWHYVRRSELKHIIPYQGTADFIVNSSLAYELPFLKRHLAAHFPGMLEKIHGDARRLDAVIRAERVIRLFDSLADATAEDEAVVPPASLLREFIGGSAYDVHS